MATTTFPLLLPRIVCAAFFACLPGLVAGIRKDIGLAAPIMCRSTVQGRHLISDDNGRKPCPSRFAHIYCLASSVFAF
uniref:Secreted protein n=1 Tax=Oryza barthii TaxID=65489 RepID=A0A0D3HKF6_9ORYZ